MIAAGMVVLVLAAAAASCSQGTREGEMERYLRLGPRVGAAELERDLLSTHPPGSGLGQVLGRLSGLGFDCRPGADPHAVMVCRFRAGMSGNRLGSAEVTLRHDEVRVQGLSARVTVVAR